MSVSQSKLSDPRYGFDLVVAITQASVGAMLEEFVCGLPDNEILICFVRDANDNVVPGDYAALLGNAKVPDPFAIPDGSDPTKNADIINLATAHFAGAVKATIGVPNVDTTPPFLVLGKGGEAPVSLNLLCAQCQIVGFDHASGSSSWVNRSQQGAEGGLWYVSSDIKLNVAAVSPGSSVPAPVQQRIDDLQQSIQNAFTIQKLFLDLDTAVSASATFPGLPTTMPIWPLMPGAVLSAYFAQFRKGGDQALSYSFTIDTPKPATLQIASVSRECLQFVDFAQAFADPTPVEAAAATLVYMGSQSQTPPTPTSFAWNWVELAEISQLDGVMAVRRDVFAAYLTELFNESIKNLLLTPDLGLEDGSNGLDMTIDLSIDSSASANFELATQPSPADSDGFVPILSVNYTTNRNDDGDIVNTARAFGSCNYSFNGAVAVKENTMRLRFQSMVDLYVSTRNSNTDGPSGALRGEILNLMNTVLFSMDVDQGGALVVRETVSTQDLSKPVSASGPIFGGKSSITVVIEKLEAFLAKQLIGDYTSYAGQIAVAINGSKAWVFPGSNAFVLRNVAFSSGQDLTAQLAYVAPN